MSFLLDGILPAPYVNNTTARVGGCIMASIEAAVVIGVNYKVVILLSISKNISKGSELYCFLIILQSTSKLIPVCTKAGKLGDLNASKAKLSYFIARFPRYSLWLK